MALDLDGDRASPARLDQASIEFSTVLICVMQISGEWSLIHIAQSSAYRE